MKLENLYLALCDSEVFALLSHPYEVAQILGSTKFPPRRAVRSLIYALSVHLRP